MLTQLPFGAVCSGTPNPLSHGAGGLEEGSVHAGPGSRYPATHRASDVPILEAELTTEGGLGWDIVALFSRNEAFIWFLNN